MTFQDSPAKYSTKNPDAPIMSAVPRSGCLSISHTGSAISSAATTKSTNRTRASCFWKYHATTSGSAIFISSEGWNRPMPTLSQRREPLTTVPPSATAHSSNMPSAYSGTAARASCCGGTFATIHISTSAKPSETAWLVTRATL